MYTRLKKRIFSDFTQIIGSNYQNIPRKQNSNYLNPKKIFSMLTIATILAIAAILPTINQLSYAFPHANLIINQPNFNPIRMVVGHSDEPTFAISPGVNSGKHNLEISLADKETLLPLTAASLKADMYYFNSLASFNNAATVNNADAKKLNQDIGQIFGNPGFYTIREIQSQGIYGYHISGTINYFNVAKVPVDATIFCRSFDGTPTTKFNSAGWTGGFGCTSKADTISFPTLVLPTLP